jgi:hypothetical protein
MSLSNYNNRKSILIPLGSISADGSLPAMLCRKKVEIQGVSVVDVAGIAADNSNYVTITLQSGSTVIASLDSRAANQGALTALVHKDAAIVDAQKVRAAGESLKVVYDETGTVGMTNALMQIDYVEL